MDVSAFTNPSGRLVSSLQGYKAFVPNPLPRVLDLNPELVFLLSEADRHLGELAGMTRALPSPRLLTAPLGHREAVLSSRIEGTQASISDLAIFEAAGDAHLSLPADVQEVLNYRHAIDYGLTRLETLPLSLRLVRELHAQLMTGVRGQERTPGEFRTTQNWIGTPGTALEAATYVPPPPAELMTCLDQWEAFLHSQALIPPLLKCALVHYQFEAIHPFLDGNGRVGRLLLVLLLCTDGRLPAPVLYLSPYFERNRETYYAHLKNVTEKSAWAEWFRFFLLGVIAQAQDAFERSHRLTELREEFRRRLLSARAAPAAFRLMEQLFISPAVTASLGAQALGVTVMSAGRAIDVLVKATVLHEVTGRRRDRVYVAQELIDAIESDAIEAELYDHERILL